MQLTFPSIQAGSSFRVPQGTTQQRWQFADSLSLVRGPHQWKVGGQLQRVDAQFDLGVFRDGRIELVEDFPAFDRNGDGRVNDDDLLFAVTLRSGKPDQDLVIPDADNVHLAGFVQDDWRVHPRLSLNLGVRYELDTDVNNVSRVDELNPIVVRLRDAAAPARHQQLGAAARLQLVEPRRPDQHPRRLRPLLRSRHAADSVARARPGRPGAADRGAGRQPAVHGSGDRSGAAVRADRLQPVHRLHPARRRRVRHQPHRLEPAEPEGAAALDRRRAAAWERPGGAGGPGAQPRQRLHHRANGRHRLQPGRRRPGSRGQSRVERGNRLRRAAGGGGAAVLRPVRVPRRLHALEGQQLRQRRSDPVRERPDRLGRSAPRVRTGGQRPAASALALGHGRSRRPLPVVRTVDPGLRRADGHSDAERTVPHSDHSAQCRRPAVHIGRGAERLHPRRSTPAAGSTASGCRWSRRAPASTTRSTRSTSGSRGRSQSAGCGSIRWSSCSTCST